MYSQIISLHSKASASMLCNNLATTLSSTSGAADFVFLHKSVAHLLLTPSDSTNELIHRHIVCKIPSADQHVSYVFILQADWVDVAGRSILVLATQKGIKMYDRDGSTLLFWHGFGAGGDHPMLARGICSLGSSTIYVGTDCGSILQFTVPASGSEIKYESSSPGHSAPIMDLVGRGDYLASSDANGTILIHTHVNGSALKTVNTILGKGQPCTCLDIYRNILVAGYATGMIRIYDLSSGSLLADITAHAKAVSGLHIAQGSGLCVTCSEDSFVRVWELEAGPSLEVRLAYSTCIQDHQLVGVRFTDNAGKSFAAASYDSSEIMQFTRN